MNDSMQQLIMLGCIQYLLFIISITFHEAAHAWAAYRLGDSTAFYGGQVTLNPLPHIQREPMGTIVLPLVTLWIYKGMWCSGFAHAPFNLSWAMRYPKRHFVMSMAGPASNLLLGTAGMIAMQIMIWFNVVDRELVHWTHWYDWIDILLHGSGEFGAKLFAMTGMFSFMNLRLCIFNLIPVPPFDGSAVWQHILTPRQFESYLRYAFNPNIIILGYIFAAGLLTKVFDPILFIVFNFVMWGGNLNALRTIFSF